VTQATICESGSGFDVAKRIFLTLLPWLLNSPSSVFQAINTTAKGGGSSKDMIYLSWLPSLYSSLSYLVSSRLKPLNQDTETQSVLGLRQTYWVVRNDPGANQESTTDLDFVIVFRDPPRRFPLPTPMHEDR
jgi:hypothetical protein